MFQVKVGSDGLDLMISQLYMNSRGYSARISNPARKKPYTVKSKQIGFGYEQCTIPV